MESEGGKKAQPIDKAKKSMFWEELCRKELFYAARMMDEDAENEGMRHPSSSRSALLTGRSSGSVSVASRRSMGVDPRSPKLYSKDSYWPPRNAIAKKEEHVEIDEDYLNALYGYVPKTPSPSKVTPNQSGTPKGSHRHKPHKHTHVKILDSNGNEVKHPRAGIAEERKQRNDLIQAKLKAKTSSVAVGPNTSRSNVSSQVSAASTVVDTGRVRRELQNTLSSSFMDRPIIDLQGGQRDKLQKHRSEAYIGIDKEFYNKKNEIVEFANDFVRTKVIARK
jgi:hypothetical protein